MIYHRYIYKLNELKWRPPFLCFGGFCCARVPPSKAAEGARWMAEKGEELAKDGTVGSGSQEVLATKWTATPTGRVSIGIPVQASKVLRGCSTGVRVVIMPSARVH